MSINVEVSQEPSDFVTPTGYDFGPDQRPVIWDGKRNTVFVGLPGDSHYKLRQRDYRVPIEDKAESLRAEGYFFNGGEVAWKVGNGYQISDQEPAPGVNDAILEALGGTNTFMSKQAGWNDVMQWSGDALDWVSEKGLDADAAMHSRIHPEGCDDNECWVCNEGQRPKRFETPDVE